MIPNLLNVIERNGNRGFTDLSFFEIGHVYNKCAIDSENTVVCGVRYGNNGVKDFYGATRSFDIYDAKKDIFDIMGIFGLMCEKSEIIGFITSNSSFTSEK
ncbi:hypothetical protein FACS1894152_8350 [Bacilli bacterium]|nr:hypothetical protein FACS1894152_8350 [Bacilli bacterium]